MSASSSRSWAFFATATGSMRWPSASTRADSRASDTSNGLRRLPRPGPRLIADPPQLFAKRAQSDFASTAATL